MEKKHVSPEFVVIKQNEANAKFFVASGGGPITGDNKDNASNYSDGSSLGSTDTDSNDPIW